MSKRIGFWIINTTFLITLFSCSNNDEIQANSIVGEWTLVSKTISGTQVPINECEELFVLTIKPDNTLFTQFNTDNIPDECRTINFVGLEWEKISENLYQTSLLNIPVSTLSLEENRLVEEVSDSNQINFYTKKD